MTEETLGRRIAIHRKQLGLTQDALAEQLGVTAQAVSKWENDQSCPDITMLPKLAGIFEMTVDALLGVEKKEEKPLQPMPLQEEYTVPVQTSQKRRTGIGIALWLLLTGLVLLTVHLHLWHGWMASEWEVLFLTGLMVYGLFGLYPRFSVFRLGCAAAGGYYLYVCLFQPRIQLNEELLLPILLVFFGLGLLVDSLLGKENPAGHVSIYARGKNTFEHVDNGFLCSTVFGADRRSISLQEMDHGEGNVCFGELILDLQDCGSFQTNCSISLNCAFGLLELYVPRSVRLECVNRNFFGVVQEDGSPNSVTQAVIRVENAVCFGMISIKYI